MSYFEDCKFEGSLLLCSTNRLINMEQFISQMLKKTEEMPVIITPQKRLNSFKSLQEKFNFTNESTYVYSKNTKRDDFYALQKPSVVFILDCLELLIESIGIDNVAKIIYKLKEKSKLVITFADYSTISDENWNRLKGIVDSYASISSLSSNFIECEGTVFKKNGKSAPIKEALELTATGLKKLQKKDLPVENKTENEPVPTSSFNIGTELKESEKTAKEALQLPYTSSNTAEELVNLRLSDKKVRVGGQIIYTPDEADDLDDEDPDDDLNL